MVDSPSPEVRAILKSWCDEQREKYGPEWKEKLAAELAEDTVRRLDKIFGPNWPLRIYQRK